MRALVRPTTDPAHIEADGVEIARGDLLDEASHKALAEQQMQDFEVPFLSIRAGAFIDQAQDILQDGIKKGRLVWVGSRTYRARGSSQTTSPLTSPQQWTFRPAPVHESTPDGQKTYRWGDLPALVAKATGTKPSLWMIPWWLLSPIFRVIGLVNSSAPT